MYTPKNRIITNQFTQGEEYVYKNIIPQQFYVGFYYKTYTGKYYTGKTPNDPPNEELIVVKNTEVGYEQNVLQSEIAYGDFPTVFDDLDTPGYSPEMIEEYALLQEINLDESIIRKLLPNQFYPNPNIEDYALGSYTRYFCVKANQPINLELSKEVYNKLVNKDNNYLWEPYIPFKFQWTLKGDEKTVYNANKDTTLLIQRRLKTIGLGRFLNENYLKFYK